MGWELLECGHNWCHWLGPTRADPEVPSYCLLAALEMLDWQGFRKSWERLANHYVGSVKARKWRDKKRWRQVRGQRPTLAVSYLSPYSPSISFLWQPSLGDGTGWHWPQEHQVDTTLEEWASDFVQTGFCLTNPCTSGYFVIPSGCFMFKPELV